MASRYRVNLESILWFLVLSFAGFSQIALGPFKPTQLFTLALLAILLHGNGMKRSGIFAFLVLSSLYAFLLGGFQRMDQMIINTILFISIFVFKDRIVTLSRSKVIDYLNYFNFGMFISHFIALSFLFIPSFREIVVDVSSIGIRFRGFFNQANGYAFVALISTPISMFFFGRKRNLLNLTILTVNFLVLVLTQSRGAIFSLAIGFIIVYLSYLYVAGNLWKIVKPVIFGVGIVIVFFVTIPEFLSEKFGINLSRLNPTEKREHERNFADISMESLQGDRFYLINAGLRTFVEFPLGLGYQDHHTIIGDLTGVYLIPHNYYLSVFLTYGLFLGTLWNLVFFGIIITGYVILLKYKVPPSNPFFYLLVIMISVALYYFTHSPDWAYFYIMVSFYAAFLSNHDLLVLDEDFSSR
jgi:hypothetical protein